MFQPWRVLLHNPADPAPAPRVLSQHRRWRDAYTAGRDARLYLADGSAVVVVEWLTNGWLVRDILPPLDPANLIDGDRKEIVWAADRTPLAAVQLHGPRRWYVYLYDDGIYELPERFDDGCHISRRAAIEAAERLSGRAVASQQHRSSTTRSWGRLLDPFDPETVITSAAGSEVTVNVTKAFDEISTYLEQMTLTAPSSMASLALTDVVPARTWAGLHAADMLPETVDHIVTNIRTIFDQHYPNVLQRGDIDLVTQDSRPYRVIGEPARIPQHLDVAAVLMTDGLNGVDVDARSYMSAIPADEHFDLVIAVWHYYLATLTVVQTMTQNKD